MTKQLQLQDEDNTHRRSNLLHTVHPTISTHFRTMALSSEQLLIAEVVGYEPVTDDEGTQQYPADVDFQDAPKVPSPAQETSTRTRRASSVATGFQSVATTRQRNRTNSRAGTTYLTSKISKNGPSTPAVPHLQEMR
jgi:hypothetical protein